MSDKKRKRKVTKGYVKDAKSKKVVKTNRRGTTTTKEKVDQYNKQYLGRDPKNIKYNDKNIWSRRFKSKVNKEGEEIKRKEKIVFDDGNQMTKRTQRKVRFGKNKGKIKIKTVNYNRGKKTKDVKYADKTDQMMLKKGGKKKGSDGKACWKGYYYAGYDAKNKKDICKPIKKKEMGGFLEGPTPLLFED
tara:strand:+ start:250 stop:816 length:567 start_codon:yes stop_codon:yes gene_type:complete